MQKFNVGDKVEIIEVGKTSNSNREVTSVELGSIGTVSKIDNDTGRGQILHIKWDHKPNYKPIAYVATRFELIKKEKDTSHLKKFIYNNEVIFVDRLLAICTVQKTWAEVFPSILNAKVQENRDGSILFYDKLILKFKISDMIVSKSSFPDPFPERVVNIVRGTCKITDDWSASGWSEQVVKDSYILHDVNNKTSYLKFKEQDDYKLFEPSINKNCEKERNSKFKTGDIVFGEYAKRHLVVDVIYEQEEVKGDWSNGPSILVEANTYIIKPLSGGFYQKASFDFLEKHYKKEYDCKFSPGMLIISDDFPAIFEVIEIVQGGKDVKYGERTLHIKEGYLLKRVCDSEYAWDSLVEVDKKYKPYTNPCKEIKLAFKPGDRIKGDSNMIGCGILTIKEYVHDSKVVEGKWVAGASSFKVKNCYIGEEDGTGFLFTVDKDDEKYFKLVEHIPKFKVGDKVIFKDENNDPYEVVDVILEKKFSEYITMAACNTYVLKTLSGRYVWDSFSDEDNYSLVESSPVRKFKVGDLIIGVKTSEPSIVKEVVEGTKTVCGNWGGCKEIVVKDSYVIQTNDCLSHFPFEADNLFKPLVVKIKNKHVLKIGDVILHDHNGTVRKVVDVVEGEKNIYNLKVRNGYLLQDLEGYYSSDLFSAVEDNYTLAHNPEQYDFKQPEVRTYSSVMKEIDKSTLNHYTPKVIDNHKIAQLCKQETSSNQETNDTNNMLLLYLLTRSDKMDTKTMLMASMISGGKMDMNSMLPLLLLDKSDSTSGKMDDLLPLLMMSGGGKGMENMLPLLLLSDSSSKDDLLPFLLMGGGKVDENLMTMLTLDPSRVKEFLMVSMILKNEMLNAKIKRLFIQKFAKNLTDNEKQELSGNNFSNFISLRYDFETPAAANVVITTNN